jgi:hypothetical protein
MNHGKKQIKTGEQKIHGLLFYILTLSTRTDKSVNSVAICELSAMCLYEEDREAQQL